MIEQAPVRDATESRLRRAYGFEEVALVPGAVTADPAEVDLSTDLGGFRLQIPFLAAAMDAVADADFAVRLGRLGGIAFVNLEGLYTRYEDATPIIERVAAAESGRAAAHVLAEAYEQPVRDELINAVITRIKAQGVERGGGDHAGIGLAPRRARRRSRGRPLPRPVPGQQRSSPLDLDPGPLARRSHRRPEAARSWSATP